MARADTGARFWLRYVEERGGLWEDAGDSSIVVLPPALQDEYQHPDEIRVTTDPDVAREDGATLLLAGHPWLMRAAESVLGEGDCGVVRLPRPATPPRDTEQLLAAAREQFPVDHGRIDAAGGATPGMRLVLRVGALVTFAVSSDLSFTEQAECWVDVPSYLELGAGIVTRLSRLVDIEHAERSIGAPPAAELSRALHHAHQRIDERACAREAELSRQVGDDQSREVARVVAYYDEALRSLQRRRETAPPDRAATVSAKMASTHAERDRRLAEIAEKYRATHSIRPFRLHVLGVPVLRLPLDVRRGARRYPLTLDWLLPARAFAGVRCPACGSPAPLVAAKTGLGCRECLTWTDAPPEQPPATRQAPTPAPASPPESRPPARPTRPRPEPRAVAAPRPARSPQAIQKAGHKLAASLWDLAVAGDRRVRRLYAPHSPMAAMHELFGASSPLRLVGLDLGEEPMSVSSSASEPAAQGSDMLLIDGEVRTATMTYGYQLCWRFVGNAALVEELTPFDRAYWPRQPEPRYYPGGLAGRRLYAGTPRPRIDLDRVAGTLWRHSLATYGLPITLRCLAAWWRLDDRDRLLAAHSPDAVAAAVHRMIVYRAGAGGRYDDAAAVFRVEVATVRAAAADLQRRLRLSEDHPW